jgi:shikimate kinase
MNGLQASSKANPRINQRFRAPLLTGESVVPFSIVRVVTSVSVVASESRALNQHIYLTGFRGTGKTSVGRILARSLELPLIDLDDEVEQKAGKTIREIFDESGESGFRDLETSCLREVSARPRSVIALGGGAVLREENRQQITRSGVCVWLTADAKAIQERISADLSTARRRPALTSLPAHAEVEKLLADRDHAYRESADHCVDTRGKTQQAVADEILDFLSLS